MQHDLAHRGNSTYQSDPTDKLTQFAAALQELCDLAKSRGHLRVQRAHAEYKVHVAAIRNRHTHGTSAHNPACPVLTNGYAAQHPIPTLLLTRVDPPHVAAQHTARSRNVRPHTADAVDAPATACHAPRCFRQDGLVTP